MDKLHLKIVTPDKVFFDDDIEMLIARSVEGDFAILKNHVPLIAYLDVRALRIKRDGKFLLAAVAGGYLTYRNNEIVIMSDACEWSKDIDENRALRAKERAERKLKEAKDESNLDKAELQLKKAINRLSVKEFDR